MYSVGDKVKLLYVDGYEQYLGLKGVVIQHDKSINAYLVRFDSPIEGEREFFCNSKEITPY